MATVDMSHVQLWQPPLIPVSSKQRFAPLHIRKNSESDLTARLCNQSVSVDHKEGEGLGYNNHQTKSAVTAARLEQRGFAVQQENDAVET